MKNLFVHLKPYKWKIALSTFLMAVSAVCDLLLPTLMSDILDKGVYGAAEADTFRFIVKSAGLMLGISIVSLLSVIGGYRVVYGVIFGYTKNLRGALFRKVHTMTIPEVARQGTSNLVTRSTHDISTLTEIIGMLCGRMVIIPLMFLGSMILCMRKDIRLSLLILCAVPLLLGAFLYLSKTIIPLWETADHYCDIQNGLVRERLRGIRVIRAFDREKQFHEKITESTRIMADNFIRANVRMELIDPLASFVLNIIVILIVFAGGIRLERGSGLTAGDVFAIIQYVNIILGAIISVSYDIVMLPHVRVAAKRLSQITESEGIEDTRSGNNTVFAGGIDINHVTFTYPGSPVPALSDVDLHIRPGECVSIIGGTGAGKTTLTELLMDFRQPTEGSVCFDGRPATELAPKEIRDNISFSLQKSMVYSGTIAENLRMGKPDATDEELWGALELVSAADFVRELQDGLNHKIEQAGINISGGQKQRLAIARAVLKDAPIFIFDDSFSALDFITEAQVRKSLNEKLKDKTRIIITQRIVSAMHSDRIFVLSDGVLQGFGTHAELLESCPLYREIYLSQTGGDAA